MLNRLTINTDTKRRYLLCPQNNVMMSISNEPSSSFYHNGKTQASIIKEYCVSQPALYRLVKQYSTIETDDGKVLTAKQVKDLQKRMAQLEEENQILKSDCPIHATLKQRLNAVHKLCHQYDIKTLYRVLHINRSTYYKHFYSDSAPRTEENQLIRKRILQIYTDSACCESFFRHMKRECIEHKSYRNQNKLRICCFEYINRYNSKRPHSSLGDYTPDEIEEFYMERPVSYTHLDVYKRQVQN